MKRHIILTAGSYSPQLHASAWHLLSRSAPVQQKKATCCARIGVKTLHSSWKHGPEDSQTIPQMHVQRIIFWYSFSCPNIQWNAAPHTFRATKLLRSSFSRRLYLSKRRFKSDMPASVWYLFKSSKRPDSSKCGKKKLNLEICRNRLFAKKTQKIKRKT